MQYWEEAASGYQAKHGTFLSGFVWGPEGLTEDGAQLLGDVRGRRVVEVGCGAGQCTAWLRDRGAHVVGVDLSHAMLAHGPGLPTVQADARALPLPDSSFDAACSAYGALPFVPDVEAVHREVARVLRPGGRWVFAVTHPIRWVFPDDGGPRGLTATSSYWDRTPYTEDGYAEYHRTLGDWLRGLTESGFRLVDLVEPEWQAGDDEWGGGWTKLRGERLPGTVIFVTELL